MENEIRNILEEAGWYDDRQIEIDYLVEQLNSSGFTIPNVIVEAFFKEFGNLEFNFTIPNGEWGNIKLVLDEVIPYIEIQSLKIWEKLANEKLVPVGTMFNDTAYLFISYTGKFYMATENKFYFLANTFVNCLNITLNQIEILRIA